MLADRGFDISESLGLMQARLRIPAICCALNKLCDSIVPFD